MNIWVHACTYVDRCPCVGQRVILDVFLDRAPPHNIECRVSLQNLDFASSACLGSHLFWGSCLHLLSARIIGRPPCLFLPPFIGVLGIFRWHDLEPLSHPLSPMWLLVQLMWQETYRKFTWARKSLNCTSGMSNPWSTPHLPAFALRTFGLSVFEVVGTIFASTDE